MSWNEEGHGGDVELRIGVASGPPPALEHWSLGDQPHGGNCRRTAPPTKK